MSAAIASLEADLGRREEELRARRDQVARLDQEAEGLRRQLEGRDRQVIQLLADLNASRERVEVEMRSLAILAHRIEELEVTARGSATRIRLAALREAADVVAAGRGEGRDDALAAIERAVDRVAGEWVEDDGPAEQAAADEVRHDRTERPVADAADVAEGLSTRRIERLADPLPGGQLAGRAMRAVSVDIGPFEDFSQLVRFEDAANAIGETGDISIRRFSGGRARIDVSLSEPIDLLRELEERCDLDFVVRSRSESEIVLDVDAG